MAGAVAIVDSGADASNQTTYTFASKSLGTAAADRYIIVGVQHRGAVNRTVSSLTVDGISATQVHTIDRSASRVDIWIAAVPTGTTGDVVVTFNSSNSRCVIQVWRAVGIDGSAPHDIADSNAAANDPTATIDVPAGGVAVGCGMCNGATASATWSGLAEDYDANTELTMTAGSGNFASTQTGLAVTIDFTSTGGDNIGVFASWGPSGGGGGSSIVPIVMQLAS
jgi:hypothetical protein